LINNYQTKNKKFELDFRALSKISLEKKIKLNFQTFLAQRGQ